MSDWAPLVHGRTLLADYRTNLIASPAEDPGAEDGGFNAARVDWARTFAEAAMTRGDEHWVAFGDERFRVVGVACGASTLSADRYADRYGREIQVFLGWVCHAPFAPLPPRDRKLFDELYDLLLARWDEDPARGAWNRRVSLPFNRSLPAVMAPSRTVELNDKQDKRKAWPEASSDDLWLTASATAGPVSLAVGFRNLDQMSNSPFLNATIGGLGQEQWVLPSLPRVEPPAAPPAASATPAAARPDAVTELALNTDTDRRKRVRSRHQSTAPQIPPHHAHEPSLLGRLGRLFGFGSGPSRSAVSDTPSDRPQLQVEEPEARTPVTRRPRGEFQWPDNRTDDSPTGGK